MKKLILAALLITGCTSKPQQYKVAPNKNKALVVQVIDFSKSTEQITYFDRADAENLYYVIAKNGGALKLVGAYANSSKQNVFSLLIAKSDTQSVKGIKNMYEAARIRAKNNAALSAFQAKAQQDIVQYQNEVAKPHTEAYTDLQNAFSLASLSLSAPIYAKGFTKYLVICSDLINDPVFKRHAKLKPVSLDNTTVLVIRPALPLQEIQEVFPNATIHVFTNSQDAITFINQQ
jgi:hypothetical protein